MDSASLQTAVYRLSARLSENLSETARDLGLQGLDAANLGGGLGGGGAAGKYLEDGAVVTEEGVRETKKLLETRREASMAEGLRRVLAMMLKGRPVLTFFPQVVQCLSSSSSSNTSSASSIQIRSLVSLYILRQARLEPDLALLPVNMYQKDLRDPNPVVRALALRTLAGMGLESIVALVLMSLKTASRDTNWFVRRTVAESLEKVYALDPSHITSLLPILQTLLADRNPLVLGTSLAAFESICPDRNDLLHPQYRRICRSLVDTDEWSQVVMLRVLERYARTEFGNPDARRGKADPDLELLLKCAEPLFFNRNAALVLAAVRVYHRLAPASLSAKYVGPLLRLLQAPAELQTVVLSNIAVIAASRPTLFSQHHLHRFYIYQSTDSPAVRSLKLQILILLVNRDNIRTVLSELMVYIRSPDTTFVSEVVQSIGRCAVRIPAVRDECIKVLLRLVLRGESQRVTYQSLLELHHLFLGSSSSIPSTNTTTKALTKLILAFHNGRIVSKQCRAEFFAILAGFLHFLSGNLVSAIDVLRVGVKNFAKETESAKSSLLLLSTKLVLLSSNSPPPFISQLHLLHHYITSLGRYDPSWSIRDLVRFLVSLLRQAGVEIKSSANGAREDEVEAEEAFARGEKLQATEQGRDEVEEGMKQKMEEGEIREQQEKLRRVLLTTAAANTSSGRVEDASELANTQLLGTFRLISRLSASASTSNMSSASTAGSAHLPTLAGWTPLPDWATESSSHKLREPSDEDQESSSATRSYPTSFGSVPAPKTSSGRIGRNTARGGRKTALPALRERVVLVPTENSDTSAYGNQGREQNPTSAKKGLQEFLESDDDNEEEVEGEQEEEDGEEEESERSSESGGEEGESSEESSGEESSGIEDTPQDGQREGLLHRQNGMH